MASSSPTAWFPGALVGRYQLMTPLASGGMAELWLARQQGLHGFEKMVVIKRMIGALEDDPDHVEMFLTEARLAAGLLHPNVVQIYELAEDQGSFYIVMEFLDGESLSTVWKEGLKRESPLPGPLAAQIVSLAAEGLHHAHTRIGQDGEPLCIVHRDVSPQNLLVTYEGAVKVVDFGIAKVATQATSSGKLKGKLAYMSPEQGRAEQLDARSDVFSLGVVLFEMVTRTRVFPKMEELAILKHVISGAPLPLARQRRPDVPEALERIIARALAPDREQRFATARDLQLALEQFLLKTGVRTTGAAIAEYMKSLFAARIEQRRALIEAAKRGELTPGRVPAQAFVGGEPLAGDSAPFASAELVSEGPGRLRALGLGALVVAAAALLAVLGVNALGPPEVTAADAGVAPSAALAAVSRPPGAKLTLDGAGRGLTPVEVTGLAPGPHELAFALPGHAPEKRSVTLRAGERLELAVDLDPVAAQSVDAGRPRAEARAPQRPGRLTIDTTPWTSVYLGARKLGDTPVLQVPVPAGTLVLKLVNPELDLTSTVEVEILPGELTVKKLVLE